MLTKDKAKKKYCPFLMLYIDGYSLPKYCDANKCMAWEWRSWIFKDDESQKEHIYISGDKENLKPRRGVCTRTQGRTQ